MALYTAMSVGVAGTFGYLVYTEPNIKYFLPALTFQGMVLLSAYTILRQMETISSQNKGIRQLSQALMNISFPLAIFISLLSWGLGIAVDSGGLGTFKNHFYHSINSLACLVYIVMDSKVWHTRHCYQPLLSGLAYVSSQGALQWSGHPAQYSFLDFKNSPSEAGVIVLVSAILLPVIHICLCGLANFFSGPYRCKSFNIKMESQNIEFNKKDQ